jgi:hypothetical protein
MTSASNVKRLKPWAFSASAPMTAYGTPSSSSRLLRLEPPAVERLLLAGRETAVVLEPLLEGVDLRADHVAGPARPNVRQRHDIDLPGAIAHEPHDKDAPNGRNASPRLVRSSRGTRIGVGQRSHDGIPPRDAPSLPTFTDLRDKREARLGLLAQ